MPACRMAFYLRANQAMEYFHHPRNLHAPSSQPPTTPHIRGMLSARKPSPRLILAALLPLPERALGKEAAAPTVESAGSSPFLPG